MKNFGSFVNPGLRIASLCFAMIPIVYSLNAQTVAEEFKKLTDIDTVAIRSLAAYPREVRNNILVVASHPETLARLEDIRHTSASAFKELLKNFTKEEQSKIWNLTRYNGLVGKLISTKGKERKINSELEDYPAEIHADAKWMATEHRDLLIKMDDLTKQYDSSFQNLLNSYSPSVRTALSALVKTPEVITLLNDNMRTAVLLGDYYERDSLVLQQQMDSLSLVVAQENLRDREALQNAVAQDPRAAAELKESAEKFANEQGYPSSEYASPQPEVITNYVYLPYPYWFGYPWWYEYPYWYPYPYWYHWGFYFWDGQFVWLSPPSWYFIHWHFHHHHHFYDYPHITNVYIDHYYYGPRRSQGRNTMEVNHWMNRNAEILPHDFREQKDLRVDRIREIGKATTQHETYLKNNPESSLSKEEYVKQRPDEFPNLVKPSVQEKPAPQVPVKVPGDVRPPVKTPPVKKEPVKTPPPVKSPPPPLQKPVPQQPDLKTPPKQREIQPDRQSPIKEQENQPPPNRPR